MKQYQLAMPQQVFSGETGMQALESLAARHKKAAVFTDAGIRASGILERPLAELDKAAVPYIINDTLPAEPTCDQAQQVIDTFRESNADLIVAVGGGSVMDIAKTFLEGIPNELEEAAVVDGASDIKILTRVFLPLSPTVLATTGLFYAVSIWNQYLIPQIYLKDDAIKTIQQVLKNVVITDGGSGTTFKNVVLDGVTLNQQNLKAAAIFIAMLPIICVYPFVQKYFKKGILIGSVKG